MTAALSAADIIAEAIETAVVAYVGPNLSESEARDVAAHVVARLSAAGRAIVPSATVIDEAHLAHQRDWSGATFGPGPRTEGVLDHIAKESAEVRADPSDLKEWVDIIILAFDGAWRTGAEPAEIITAIKAKQERNEARTWPDWRTADPNKAIEHDRRAAAASATTDPAETCDVPSAQFDTPSSETYPGVITERTRVRPASATTKAEGDWGYCVCDSGFDDSAMHCGIQAHRDRAAKDGE